jgi:hypothetical protein
MKTKDLAVGTSVHHRLDKTVIGTIIGNKLSDGDEVVAVEWANGDLQKVNVNDLEDRSLEFAYEQIQKKMSEAAAALDAARILATANHTSLYSLNDELNFSDFFEALDSAGWSTSSMFC